MSTTGALANDGYVALDTIAGDGGSSLTVGGTLTNGYYLGIGNATLSASDDVTAASLDNTGKIQLTGSSANQALLDVTAGSAGFGTAEVLSGNVQLSGDSAIEFKSGEITSLAASAYLVLNGNDAFIEDSTAPGSNSALMGLASIGAGATLDLENGASGSTTGALTNSGFLFVDPYYSAGGSTLSIGGALTNTDELSIGDPNPSSSDSVSAKSFVNSGTVYLYSNGANFSTLNVLGSTTNNGYISISTTEELAGAVGGAGSFAIYESANLQFELDRLVRADHCLPG